MRVTLPLDLDLARRAVTAWQRDDGQGLPRHETEVESQMRHRAGTLGLIGLSIEERGTEHDGEVVVDLDAWYIGSALDAADADGKL